MNTSISDSAPGSFPTVSALEVPCTKNYYTLKYFTFQCMCYMYSM
ncbi:hypothetical protein [Elizabethkingia ursingii]|nr:hypothetical protein [Elizabethkingia ursingii]